MSPTDAIGFPILFVGVLLGTFLLISNINHKPKARTKGKRVKRFRFFL